MGANADSQKLSGMVVLGQKRAKADVRFTAGRFTALTESANFWSAARPDWLQPQVIRAPLSMADVGISRLGVVRNVTPLSIVFSPHFAVNRR